MNSSVTSQPQPLYQISPRPRIGAISVEVLSYILLGLGALVPIVFLVTVAVVIHCYRRHKATELDRWKKHMGYDRRSVTSSARSSQARRGTKAARSDLENLSFSLQDSDLGLEPYLNGGGGAVNRASDLNDTVDFPDLKRSVTNSNVFFKDDGKKTSRREDADSAIADSEPGSSLTDHQSSVSSSADYRIRESNGHATDSGTTHVDPQALNSDGRRVTYGGHQPGVIMGVSHLMDSTGRSNDRTNRNGAASATGTVGLQPTKGRAPPPPTSLSQLEFTRAEFNPSAPPPSMADDGKDIYGVVERGRDDLENDEEQVLRYFDDLHSSLSLEMDNPSSSSSSSAIGQNKSAPSPASTRRHSDFSTTRL